MKPVVTLENMGRMAAPENMHARHAMELTYAGRSHVAASIAILEVTRDLLPHYLNMD